MPDFINATNITPPRVPLIDQRTGLMSREWYRFFLSLFRLTGSGTNFTSLSDLQLGPPSVQLESISFDPNTPSNAPSDSSLVSQTAEMQKEIEGLQAMPPDGVQELTAFVQQQFNALGVTPQPPLGTMAALQQAWLPWVTFDNAPEFTPPTVGTLAWDGGTTLGVQMTANVLGRINESAYYYVKASSAITLGDVVMFTGAVGSSGVPTGAPATGITDGSYIMGVAAESIALNGFGLIQFAGTLKGLNTSAYADGDILWYNPAVTGGLTKTKPSAPNVKVQMAAVINAGAGGSGSILIRVNSGSVLGGTDSNVQFGTLANGDLIQYDSALQYWKNVAPSSISIGTATNIAGGAAGSVPYQSAPSTTTFLPVGTALQVLKVNSGATAPEWVSGAALTKTDDTNVTLTLGGSPTTSLLAATSLTLGWTGQLGLTRGGTNASLTASAGSVAYSTASALALNTAGSSGDWLKSGGTGAPAWTSPAALTKTDDTNVTLTLGGSASTALLNAASLTLGWTGQLAVSRGGTGLSSGTSGGIPYFSSTSAISSSAALTQYGVVYGGGAGGAPVATAAGTTGQVLTATTGGAPTWASPAYTGTVTSVSVVSANGFAGSVATATTTPAITISTSITGLLYGNGTAIAAATVSSPLSYSAGTLSIPVATSSANGYLSSTDWSTFNNKQSVSAPVTQTANFSVGATDLWIINNKSGSSCTATLPAASSYTGRVLHFQNYQAQTLVSASSNVVQITGGAATTSILLASAGDQCTLVSDGTNWIMTQYTPNNILLLE